jgi:malonyl-CoA O-methyltransferase
MGKLGPDNRPGFRQVDIVEGYDRWASSYDQDPNPLIALEQQVALELIGSIQGQHVLDLGCGTGRYCALLAEAGATVVGIDLSSEMLEHARQSIGPNSPFELGQIAGDRLAFPDGRFDLVVCALTVGHLRELQPAFAEIVRVLKNGGRLVISDIHPYWPVSGHDYVEFFDGTGQEYRLPIYAHLVEEYWRLCQKFGLRLEDIREPTIDGRLIAQFPSMEDYRGIPLAIALKLRKSVDSA